MKQLDLKELKNLRKEKKIKINELSKTTGISRNLISRIENGKGNPTFDNVTSLINALGLELIMIIPNK